MFVDFQALFSFSLWFVHMKLQIFPIDELTKEIAFTSNVLFQHHSKRYAVCYVARMRANNVNTVHSVDILYAWMRYNSDAWLV